MDNSNNNVFVYIAPIEINQLSGTFMLNNKSDKDLHFDNFFILEIKDGDIWRKLDKLSNILILDIANRLNAGTTREFEVNWGINYGQISYGLYRIKKDIFTLSYDGNGRTKVFEVISVFEFLN